jgi:hypothetical protein
VEGVLKSTRIVATYDLKIPHKKIAEAREAFSLLYNLVPRRVKRGRVHPDRRWSRDRKSIALPERPVSSHNAPPVQTAGRGCYADFTRAAALP